MERHSTLSTVKLESWRIIADNMNKKNFLEKSIYMFSKLQIAVFYSSYSWLNNMIIKSETTEPWIKSITELCYF